MTRTRTLWIVAAIAAVALIMSAVAYPNLPERTPSHWNAQGEVDGYSTRGMATLLLPLTMIGLGAMLLFLPVLDPLKANVDLFRPVYHLFVVAFSLFFTYLHALSLAAGLGWRFNMNAMLIPATGLIFFLIGFLIERAKQNWFIGIRTPWTLSSVSVWDKTHRAGAWMFKITGLITMLGMVFPKFGLWLMLVPLMVAGLGSVIISYIYFRQEQKS
jgi:uncharacterized membrane protein